MQKKQIENTPQSRINQTQIPKKQNPQTNKSVTNKQIYQKYQLAKEEMQKTDKTNFTIRQSKIINPQPNLGSAMPRVELKQNLERVARNQSQVRPEPPTIKQKLENKNNIRKAPVRSIKAQILPQEKKQPIQQTEPEVLANSAIFNKNQNKNFQIRKIKNDVTSSRMEDSDSNLKRQETPIIMQKPILPSQEEEKYEQMRDQELQRIAAFAAREQEEKKKEEEEEIERNREIVRKRIELTERVNRENEKKRYEEAEKAAVRRMEEREAQRLAAERERERKAGEHREAARKKEQERIAFQRQQEQAEEEKIERAQNQLPQRPPQRPLGWSDDSEGEEPTQPPRVRPPTPQIPQRSQNNQESQIGSPQILRDMIFVNRLEQLMQEGLRNVQEFDQQNGNMYTRNRGAPRINGVVRLPLGRRPENEESKENLQQFPPNPTDNNVRLLIPIFAQRVGQRLEDLTQLATNLTEIQRLLFSIQFLQSNMPQTQQNQGLTEQQITQIPVVKFRKTTQDEVTCTICMNDIHEGTEVKAMTCLHKFHPGCIDAWLKAKAQCPNCKADQKEYFE